MAFSTNGCRHRNGITTGNTSGATFKVTCRRSPNRAFSSARYLSIERSSSANVVKSPSRRKEHVGELDQQVAGALRVGAHG
jgi:hypothetical protein